MVQSYQKSAPVLIDHIISLAKSGQKDMERVCKSIDFYSLSTCRDLLYHVQEIRFDLTEIELMLEKLHLEFLGFEIPEPSIIKRFKRAKKYASYLPSVFLKQLAKEDFAFLQEKMHKYTGFYIQKRIIRDYPIKAAANVLGYIGEVNEEKAKKSDYYQSGELEGKEGVERQYEDILRGRKGKKYFRRNNLNKITGSFENGKNG